MKFINYFRFLFAADIKPPYEYLGFRTENIDGDENGVGGGSIPSEGTFIRAVQAKYKQLMKDHKDDIPAQLTKAIDEFKNNIRAIYNGFRGVYLQGKTKNSALAQYEETRSQLALLEESLRTKKKDFEILHTGSYEDQYVLIAQLLREIQAGSVKLDLPYHPERDIEDPAGPDKNKLEVHPLKVRVPIALEYHNIKAHLLILQELLSHLMKSGPASPAPRLAGMTQEREDLNMEHEKIAPANKELTTEEQIAKYRSELVRLLRKDIRDTEDRIAQTIKIMHGLWKRSEISGQEPKMETVRSIKVSPAADIENMIMLKETGRFTTTEKSTQTPHYYAWLFKRGGEHDFISSVLKSVLNEKEEEIPAAYSQDIADTIPEFKKSIYGLRRLMDRIYSELMDPQNGIKEISAGSLKDLNINEHMMLAPRTQDFENIKNLYAFLKEKLDPITYHKFIEYDDIKEDFVNKITGDPNQPNYFKIPQKDIDAVAPKSLYEIREKMHKFFEIINKMKKNNSLIKTKKWNPFIKRIQHLQSLLSDLKTDFNLLLKDDTFKRWLNEREHPFTNTDRARDLEQGPVPSESETKPVQAAEDKSVLYKNPAEGYNKVVEKIKKLVDFVTGDSMFHLTDMNSFCKELQKKGKDFDKWINDLSNLMTEAVKAVDVYEEGIVNFIDNIQHGRVFRAPTTNKKKKTPSKKKPEESELTNVMPTEENEETGTGDEETLKAAASELPSMVSDPSMSRSEEYRSEYPIGISPQKKKLGPGGVPTRQFVEYFEKSFPVEEFLNKWNQVSGGTLDPKKLEKLLNDSVKQYIKDQVSKNLSIPVLEKHIGECDDKIKKIQNKILELDKSVNEIGPWAVSSFKTYEEAIDLAVEKNEVARADVIKYRDAQKKLKEDLDNSIKYGINIDKIKDQLKVARDEMFKIFSNLDTMENPFTHKKEPIESVKNKARQVWDEYNGQINRDLRQIKELQNSELTVSIDRQKTKEMNESDSEGTLWKRKHDFFYKSVVAYIWQNIDHDWLRSIQAFQSKYNVNFEDYLNIYEEFKRLAQGHAINAWALASILKEARQEVSFLKKNNGPKEKLDHAREVMKRLEALTKGRVERSKGGPEVYDPLGSPEPHEPLEHIPGGTDKEYDRLKNNPSKRPAYTGHPVGHPDYTGMDSAKAKRFHPNELDIDNNQQILSDDEILDLLHTDENGEKILSEYMDILKKIGEVKEPSEDQILPLARRLLNRVKLIFHFSDKRDYSKTAFEEELLDLLQKAVREIPKYFEAEKSKVLKGPYDEERLHNFKLKHPQEYKNEKDVGVNIKEKDRTPLEMLNDAEIQYEKNILKNINDSYAEKENAEISKQASRDLYFPLITSTVYKVLRNYKDITETCSDYDKTVGDFNNRNLTGMSASIAQKFIGVEIEQNEYKASLQ